MKARLTSYYDPDDPPRASRTDEADRLLGKAAARAVIYIAYVFAVGGEPMDAFFSLIELGGWRLAIGSLILLWTLAPLAFGVEHLLLSSKLAEN
jgi:hypothetical protein